MRIEPKNRYHVSFGGYSYYTNAVSKCHAKTKVYNQIKKTEPIFISDTLINSADIKVRSL